MPQNKPMKIQWITVNGRQVPLVLPQTYSYEIEDWKVTSDRDPLPVVEYGTTAGGVVVPKRVSGEGHEFTQITGRKVKLRRVFESIDETVSAGKDIAVTIQPTEGYMITGVVNLFLQAEGIPTATEGTHRFEIRIRTVTWIYDEVAIVQTNHNNPIIFRSWQESPNVIINPVGKDAFISIVKNIHATKSLPFILRYRNDTDGDQTGVIRVAIFLKEEAVTDD